MIRVIQKYLWAVVSDEGIVPRVNPSPPLPPLPPTVGKDNYFSSDMYSGLEMIICNMKVDFDKV